ncbi:MAG: glycoside hydrolase family 30 beta sandwich domain-containing protein [Christensenellales bacterium]|jgi:glucosylceramidase
MKMENGFLYRTRSDATGKYKLTDLPPVEMQPGKTLDENTLLIDPRTQHQPMLGFGGTWTDTDVYNLLRMSPEKQEEVLTALFDPEKGAGWNFMRLPFGSTDWESTYDFYTYDDMPRGEKDWELAHFSIQRDIDRGLFKLARRCKEINPEVIFLGSVWGVPGWMKNNDSIMYGIFDPQYTDVYARYLRKTVQAYAEQGVELYAVTPQNESLTGDDRATPACRFTWRLQRDVILALRKEFDAHDITTQIWIYDHNFDMARYFVEPMLADEAARKALDGVAFHDYGGSPEEMGRLQAMYPEIPFYMTERRISSVSEMNNMVEQFQNGSRSYIQWTTMTDEYGGPHQYIGIAAPYRNPRPETQRTFIWNLRDDPDTWSTSPAWGLYGQFTKFLRRGARRVDCTPGCRKWVKAIAWQEESGRIAVTVVNENPDAQVFTLRCGSLEAALELPAETIETYRFLPQGDYLPLKAAPEKQLPDDPAWDITPVSLTWEGELKAGEKLLFSCRVKNVGALPTPPRATLLVQFSLDGDEPIARATGLCPVLQPGEETEVTANVPYGTDIRWTATPGWHNLFARPRMGGDCFPEKNTANNCIGTEIFVEGE